MLSGLLFRSSSIVTSSKIYKGIDEMPIHNWFRLEDTGDLSWILKPNKRLYWFNLPSISKTAEDLSEAYFAKHVLKGKYLQFLKLKKKWALLIAKSIETQDRKFEMEADMVNAEIERRFPQVKNQKQISRQEAFLSLESFMDLGVLNPKEMTVDEYYERLEFSEKKAKKIEAEYKKSKQDNG